MVALADCSLHVAPGEVYGLLGPNGAGKTTLLRLLLGFLRPTRGKAGVGGLDCYRQSLGVRRLVAYLPGDARLFRHMTGREVLGFFAGARGDRKRRAAHALAERWDLDLARRISAYSTGMRQKLALAAVFGAPTPIVILDEPTANLDPTMRRDLVCLVRDEKRQGRTVLFSSHVLEEVEAACDRVAILRRGELVHEQVMSELRRQHRIRAHLTAPLPPAPPHLARELAIEARNGEVIIYTPGELSPLLGWLATLPLAEVHVQPVGLRAVYDRVHAKDES
jgi:ABC-2 type transport system ATP-binding protein